VRASMGSTPASVAGRGSRSGPVAKALNIADRTDGCQVEESSRVAYEIHSFGMEGSQCWRTLAVSVTLTLGSCGRLLSVLSDFVEC